MLDGIDARNGTRDQNFRSEPPCLPKGGAGKLVAGYAARKAEIILDPRRRSSLPARRLSLDYDGAKSFGCPVDRRRKASGSATDNGNIVFGSTRGGLESESVCKIPHVGVFDQGTICQPGYGTIGR